MADMLETALGANAVSAIVWIVLALLALVALLVVLRFVRSIRSGLPVSGGRHRAPRLAVVDAVAVDAHRRLVLVRRDNVEHLVLIGGPSDVVVEQNIVAGDVHRAIAERQMRMPAATQKPAPRPRPAPAPAASQPRNAEPRAPAVTPEKTGPEVTPRAPSPIPSDGRGQTGGASPSTPPRRHAVAVTPPEAEPEAPHAEPEPVVQLPTSPKKTEPRFEPPFVTKPAPAPAPAAEPSGEQAEEDLGAAAELSMEEEMARLLDDIVPEKDRRTR